MEAHERETGDIRVAPAVGVWVRLHAAVAAVPGVVEVKPRVARPRAA